MPNECAFKQIPGSICAPRGFECGAVFCDIKRLGTGKGSEKGRKNDLALIVSEVPAVVAGMFTSNQVCAAPVKVSAKVAKRNFARVVVVNSGNANACTGTQGIKDARAMAEITAASVAAVYDRRAQAGRIPYLPFWRSETPATERSQRTTCSFARPGGLACRCR
jgi:N-acetylglutamate synthase/N-acetylornithine aminotransferase